MAGVPEIVEKKLLLDGHVYYRTRLPVKGRTYWQCVRTKSGECTSRLVTMCDNGRIVIAKSPGAHEHPPDREKARAEAVKYDLKRQAQEHPEQPPAQILRRELPRFKACFSGDSEAVSRILSGDVCSLEMCYAG
ncbi:hypothetical protein QAD02_019766 [Eretmocerus hayati]|uniref:Uncharacterized protein n=1 Tax=Eretmocerus hayati TaxID=131215 RepID=A0ACC2PN14_9HYME|nr:hypothetical protein QAD02_019766 [Eretmocerus hayati]